MRGERHKLVSAVVFSFLVGVSCSDVWGIPKGAIGQADSEITALPNGQQAISSVQDTGVEARPSFSSVGVNLLSNVPTQSFPGTPAGNANDVWGYVSSSGREYAILGMRNTTGFVDITDPTAPVILANIDDASSTWSDIAVYQEYAYNVNENSGGMQIFDLSQIDEGIVNLIGAVGPGEGFQSAHNVYINEASGYAYPCGTNLSGGFGFLVYDLDVAGPANPQLVGGWNESYAHDLYVTSYDDCPYPARAGQPCEIAFSFSANILKVVDVTDKSNMFTIASRTYPHLSYCHQGWLSEDRQTLFVGDEGDELSYGDPTTTFMFDVQDVSNPIYLDSFNNGQSAIDHNLMVRGNFVVEANYTTGLRIFDASDLNNVVEVGYYDTFPDGDWRGYDGAWGIYSGLPSGVILISDQKYGLFVLDAYPTIGCQQDSHCNDGSDCTTDVCDLSGSLGQCVNTLLPEGTSCNDGDGCTVDAGCNLAGECVGTPISTISCTDDSPCLPGACNTDTGMCFCLECVTVAEPEPEVSPMPKNRYITFTPTNPGVITGLRVTFTSLPSPYNDLNGMRMWVTQPHPVSEGSLEPGEGTGSTFMAAGLSCSPTYMDWGSVGPINVYGLGIIPSGSYGIQAISQACMAQGVSTYSPAVFVNTSAWGDLVGECVGGTCSEPDADADFDDISAVVDKFRNLPIATSKTRMDVAPGDPDFLVDFVDIPNVVDAFRALPYSFEAPDPCASPS